jgi:hypothetical protein
MQILTASHFVIFTRLLLVWTFQCCYTVLILTASLNKYSVSDVIRYHVT